MSWLTKTMRRSNAPVPEVASSSDDISKHPEKSSGSDVTEDYVSRLPLPLPEVPIKQAAKSIWDEERKE